MSPPNDAAALWLQLLRDIVPKTWPDQLLHFTKLATLKEIVRTKSVVLFNALTMTDREEVAGNLLVLRRHLSSASQLRALLDQLNGLLSSAFAQQFLAHFEKIVANDFFGTYVFCLSEEHTDHPEGRLSMWRAYGGDGAGVAIGFKTALIQSRWDAPAPVLFYKVRYENEGQMLATAGTLLKTFASLSPKIRPIFTSKPDIVFDALYQLLLIVAATRKHPGFSEESEWRVIYASNFGDGSSMLQPDTFAFGNTVRLGYRLSLSQYLTNFHPPAVMDDLIGNVIVGPCDPQVPVAQAVEKLLADLGCKNPGAKIRLCQTPYRANK